ncbi:MAG TPA: SsrA-binding protein SmpB [Chitinophagaceae bacterium]|jgi:SsrA-binding protein|nr:SsrA-binding protein SmpB [Chitinophagaceae bacterium]
MEIRNRSAYFEYQIDDKYDAGLVLTGTEVKALRGGKASFNDAYCLFHGEELYVRSFHISEYELGTYNNHDPLRERKLLLNKKELRKILAKIKEKGFTIIPLRVFFSESGKAKMQIGLARGKKLHDKRESIKQREADRELRRMGK